ncbi:KH domain-containing protein, partial [Candidatus Woesearchaeota archaeon]|nr:KH domain-containing protein [Candidatus Woesearchaeota archaeon]
ITNVTSQKLVDVSMRGPGFRKLEGGRILEVNTNKVPRIIGKEGSMITMIKNATGCKITVGQNGLVWISGEPDKENIAIEAIKKAEKESHTQGLTDQIKGFLEKKCGKIEMPAETKEHTEETEQTEQTGQSD